MRSSGFQLHKIILTAPPNYFSNNKRHYKKGQSSGFAFSLQKYKERSAQVLPAFGLLRCFLTTANAHGTQGRSQQLHSQLVPSPSCSQTASSMNQDLHQTNPWHTHLPMGTTVEPQHIPVFRVFSSLQGRTYGSPSRDREQRHGRVTCWKSDTKVSFERSFLNQANALPAGSTFISKD